jgi:hypothetical protein
MSEAERKCSETELADEDVEGSRKEIIRVVVFRPAYFSYLQESGTKC